MISKFTALIIFVFLLSCAKDHEFNNREQHKNKIKQEARVNPIALSKPAPMVRSSVIITTMKIETPPKAGVGTLCELRALCSAKSLLRNAISSAFLEKK